MISPNGDQDLAQFIAATRKGRGETQEQVVERMPDKYTAVQLSRWENGAIPRLDAMAALAAALEVELTELLAHVGGADRQARIEYLLLEVLMIQRSMLERVEQGDLANDVDINAGKGVVNIQHHEGDGDQLQDVEVTQDEADKGPEEEE